MEIPAPLLDAILPAAPGTAAAKAAIAAATAALVLVSARASARHRRLRDVALAGLGLAGLAGLWGFEVPPGRLNLTDVYVYFVGVKYFPELGYQRLYHCTAVAEGQWGSERRAEVAARRMRDLTSNRLTWGRTALADPAPCSEHFALPRWQAFHTDLAYLRSQVEARRWRVAQTDHGYNATPAWAIVGAPLARAGPASPERLRALAWIDPVLVGLLWVATAWAFGWRPACVAAVFVGTAYCGPAGFVTGAFLRFDWLFALGLGLALLRRERLTTLAGFLLGWSALLRVFPALLLVPLAGKALVSMARRRSWRPEPAHGRMAAGVLAALLLALPLSIRATSPTAWSEFVDNSRLHVATASLNVWGLPALLSYGPDTRSVARFDLAADDPFAAWQDARRDAARSRRPLHLALVVAFCVWLVAVVSRQPDWVAALLGAGLVPIALGLSSYYSAVLFAFAFLTPLRPGIGAALCAFAAAGWGLAWQLRTYDDIYAAISLLTVVLVVYATAAIARSAPR